MQVVLVNTLLREGEGSRGSLVSVASVINFI